MVNEKFKGKKFEYLEVLYLSNMKCRMVAGKADYGETFAPPEMDITINQLGEMGFELVTFYSNGNKWPRAIFKREIIDKERSNEVEALGYECEHCGYQQVADFIFCPKCKRNDEGKIEVTSS